VTIERGNKKIAEGGAVAKTVDLRFNVQHPEIKELFSL